MRSSASSMSFGSTAAIDAARRPAITSATGGEPRGRTARRASAAASTARRARAPPAHRRGAARPPGRPRRPRPGCAGRRACAATKNLVSKRFGSTSGVIQCDHGPQQVGAKHQSATVQQLRERQRAVEQREPVGLPVVVAGVGDHAVRVLAGQQHARTPRRSPAPRHTPARASGGLVARQRAGPSPPGPGRPTPRSRTTRPAGRPSRPETRRTRPRTPSTPSGGAGRPPGSARRHAIAQQDTVAACARLGHRQLAALEPLHGLDHAGEHRRQRHRRPSRRAAQPADPARAELTTISTSTGASSGSTATPTALRACVPASPKTSPSSCARAVDDAGLAGERRRAGHVADDLDDAQRPASRSPTSALTAASALSAQVRARPAGRLRVDLGADLPGRRQLAPSTIGSWPEVQTRSPTRTAGTYAASGAATAGSGQPELGQPVLDSAHRQRPFQVGDQLVTATRARGRPGPAPSRRCPRCRGSASSHGRAVELSRTPISARAET